MRELPLVLCLLSHIQQGTQPQRLKSHMITTTRHARQYKTIQVSTRQIKSTKIQFSSVQDGVDLCAQKSPYMGSILSQKSPYMGSILSQKSPYMGSILSQKSPYMGSILSQKSPYMHSILSLVSSPNAAFETAVFRLLPLNKNVLKLSPQVPIV